MVSALVAASFAWNPKLKLMGSPPNFPLNLKMSVNNSNGLPFASNGSISLKYPLLVWPQRSNHKELFLEGKGKFLIFCPTLYLRNNLMQHGLQSFEHIFVLISIVGIIVTSACMHVYIIYLSRNELKLISNNRTKYCM